MTLDSIPFGNPLIVSAIIACIGLIVARLEDLSCIIDFSDKGLLSWQVYKYRFPLTAKGFIGKILDFLFYQKHFKIMLVANMIGSVIVFLGLWKSYLIIPGLAITLITCLLIVMRSSYGLDGSDQMTIIVLTSALVGSIAKESSIAYQVSVWFVALQLALAYFVSGIYKLISPVWRSGKAMQNILWLEGYGAKWAYSIVGTSRFAALLSCWFVISWELLFPVVFIANDIVLWSLLIIGLLFHIGCAAIMGLNNFLFAFSACYPCIIWCLARVRC